MGVSFVDCVCVHFDWLVGAVVGIRGESQGILC